MRARCAVVPKGEGERARKYLSEAGLLRDGLSIERDSESIFIPVKRTGRVRYPTRMMEVQQKEARPVSYKELLTLPRKLMAALPTAFDLIGDVLVLKLPGELNPHRGRIGEAMLEAYKNVKCVALDVGVEGEARVRRLQVIAGRKSTMTTHRENGLRIRVDPSLVYFSPRLASERARIAGLVRDGEKVLDMFAGVGPFSLLVAKMKRSSEVIAIDVNSHAVELLCENIILNRAYNVTACLGDAREAAADLNKMNRIIMNLPHTAHEFLGVALGACAKGGTIHLYQHVTRGETKKRWREIAAICEENGSKVKLAASRIVHPYSPNSDIMVYDIIVG